MKMQHRGWEALRQMRPAARRRTRLARWLHRALTWLRRVHLSRAKS